MMQRFAATVALALPFLACRCHGYRRALPRRRPANLAAQAGSFVAHDGGFPDSDLLSLSSASIDEWRNNTDQIPQSWQGQQLEYRSPWDAEVRGLVDGKRNVCLQGHLAPEFILVGAQKCATTSFAAELSASLAIVHPVINASAGDPHCAFKELHIFDEQARFKMGKTFWLSHYPTCQRTVRQVATDCTPNYLQTPEAPSRIKKRYGRHAGSITFMIILREPLARMQSAFYHGKIKGWWPFLHLPPTFGELVEDAISDERSKARQHGPIIGSSYREQIANFLSTFKPSQFMIVPMSYAVQVPASDDEPSVSQALYDRLGISGPRHSGIHINTHAHPPLTSDLLTEQIEAMQAILEPVAGARAVAKELAIGGGIQLYGYSGDPYDVEAITKWLADTW